MSVAGIARFYGKDVWWRSSVHSLSWKENLLRKKGHQSKNKRTSSTFRNIYTAYYEALSMICTSKVYLSRHHQRS